MWCGACTSQRLVAPSAGEVHQERQSCGWPSCHLRYHFEPQVSLGNGTGGPISAPEAVVNTCAHLCPLGLRACPPPSSLARKLTTWFYFIFSIFIPPRHASLSLWPLNACFCLVGLSWPSGTVCEWRSEETVLEFCTLRAPNTPEAWACRGHCPGPSVGQVQHPPGPRPLTACPASSETVGPTGS